MTGSFPTCSGGEQWIRRRRRIIDGPSARIQAGSRWVLRASTVVRVAPAADAQDAATAGLGARRDWRGRESEASCAESGETVGSGGRRSRRQQYPPSRLLVGDCTAGSVTLSRVANVLVTQEGSVGSRRQAQVVGEWCRLRRLPAMASRLTACAAQPVGRSGSRSVGVCVKAAAAIDDEEGCPGRR